MIAQNCTIFTVRAKTCAAIIELIPLPKYNQFDIFSVRNAIFAWLYSAWQSGLIKFSEYMELREITENYFLLQPTASR